MIQQTLCRIRGDSRPELKERIYKYFDEINKDPVVFCWGWNLEDDDENITVQTLIS